VKHHRLLAAVLLSALVIGRPACADEPVSLKNYKTPDVNKKDEPAIGKFSLDKATHFLDSAALYWTQKQGCFSCHTNYAYLYARPHLAGAAPAHAEVRQALEEMINKRWPEKGPRWDAEVVASAAALAYNDAQTTKKLHPATRIALDRMWKVQQKDGGFSWLKCGWPPMENDDHYGVTLAAVAVGVAPDGYASTDAAQQGLDRIRAWLKANPPQNLHHKAMMLWAATYLDGFVTDDAKQETIKTMRSLQLADGGWSAASLGTWKRGDKLEQDPKTSDGYGTGFVIFVLRRAGVPADDPAVQKGIVWLKGNQRESGRWFTRSLNRDNKHYLTHTGTAFALMALALTEPTAANVK
jgi:squalene-hopene/tetraprenyl-beta-curcumene cyclase